MLAVIGWIERRRSAETAELVKHRTFHALREAAECVRTGIPEYVGGTIAGTPGGPSEGARRTAELALFARALAKSLDDWAVEIEADHANERVSEDGNSIVRDGEIWHIRYRNEARDYPVQRNQAIGWLEQLLRTPNRQLTVADLRRDPEGKIAADAHHRSEPETDSDGLTAIKNRLSEIDEITDVTGGSESLDNERAELLGKLKYGSKRLESPLKKEYHNLATQIRKLVKKLSPGMPQLAEHLSKSLKFDFPNFGYFPPSNTPVWKS